MFLFVCLFFYCCFALQSTASTTERRENTQPSGSRREPIQESFGLNPDTGIPSPRATRYRGHPVEPAPPPTSSGLASSVKVVREVGASSAGVGLSPATVKQKRKYDPSSYQGTCVFVYWWTHMYIGTPKIQVVKSKKKWFALEKYGLRFEATQLPTLFCLFC